MSPCHSQAKEPLRVSRWSLAGGVGLCLLLYGLIGWMGLNLLLHGWPHVYRHQYPQVQGIVILGVAVLGVGLTLWTVLPAALVLWRSRTPKEEA